MSRPIIFLPYFCNHAPARLQLATPTNDQYKSYSTRTHLGVVPSTPKPAQSVSLHNFFLSYEKYLGEPRPLAPRTRSQWSHRLASLGVTGGVFISCHKGCLTIPTPLSCQYCYILCTLFGLGRYFSSVFSAVSTSMSHLWNYVRAFHLQFY